MRADRYCAAHYGSRTKAAEAIGRGEVTVNGRAVEKPSEEISDGDAVEFRAAGPRFVSNGGYKLDRALEAFGTDVRGLVFADIGASTGGFTDCLLQRGARRVYCVDVGESQLAETLREDPRVVRMDGRNARYLTAGDFPETVDGIAVDVSFISLEIILPVLCGIVRGGGTVLALIKPQFECGSRKALSKGGIVKDARQRGRIVGNIYDLCAANGLCPQDLVNAPLRERKNVEYIILLEKGGSARMTREEAVGKAEHLV